MKINAGRLSVLSCFFLIGYFVLHEFNENYGLINWTTAFRLFFNYIIFAFIFFSCSLFILRAYKSSIFLSFFAVFFFLFFGALHDFIKSLTEQPFLRSHIFLFSVVSLILIGAIFLLKKKPGLAGRILPFFLLYSFILLLWEVCHLGVNVISKKQSQNTFFSTDIGIVNHAGNVRPDIFYIVFDSYTSSDCLAKDFNYSNQQLDSLLYSYGFYMVSNSNSNYPLTPFSIASTLSLQYLNFPVLEENINAGTMLQGAYSVKYSCVPRFLESQGYAISNYSIFDLNRFPARSKSYFNSVGERLIDEQTMWGRFKRNLLWNFTVETTASGKPEFDKNLRQWRKEFIDNFIEKNEQGLVAAANSNDTIPRFVYCHLMLPHEPYFFSSDGTLMPDSGIFNKRNPKEKFLNQTIYANSKIRYMLSSIMKNRRKPFAVIIQGDHGFRDFDNIGEKKKIFKNLNAIYFSDGDYHTLYDSMSNVNTFRIVFNKYFNSGLEILKDSVVYVKDPSFNFEKQNK